MSLLVLDLPPGPPGSYAWATSTDGHAPDAHGEAVPALLPSAARSLEVVARVPAARLSWHRVELPRGIGPRSPRLRAVLTGLLEERVLEEPQTLHFALEPRAGGGGPVWVAVCRRDWLDAHLRALAAAGRTVARVVPELAPDSGTLQLMVVGEPEHPRLLASGSAVPGGVQNLPLSTSSLALLQGQLAPEARAAARLDAEPAVAALAEQLLGQPPALVAPAERLLRSASSAWDLAQGELARTGAAWAARRVAAGWRDFLHAPRWRPARWGLVALLLAQLGGLNLAAWQTRAELQEQRADIRALLGQAFPEVRVVVDAPVQMAREVALLRQAAGASSQRDLEPMLAAYARIAPADAQPSAIEFTPGELRLRGLQWAADALAQAQTRLRPLGYRMLTEGDSTVLREELAP
ncbi:MAG TPA: type II secretion system protein GspL [Ottowia sp.]|uniref:type II secretion system protein GspL n=1 Tax=Ottowia sp. TaxID=1898956 RepID=UPI002BE4B8FC|nr:type II secretion system protein GspL [Ottowia sp.]HMN19766.1 type II secretion system protein GspL [Ottowia sp.]